LEGTSPKTNPEVGQKVAKAQSKARQEVAKPEVTKQEVTKPVESSFVENVVEGKTMSLRRRRANGY
jgi:hypothetical protein